MKFTDLAKPLHWGTFCKNQLQSKPFWVSHASLVTAHSVLPSLTLLFVASGRAGYPAIPYQSLLNLSSRGSRICYLGKRHQHHELKGFIYTCTTPASGQLCCSPLRHPCPGCGNLVKGSWPSLVNGPESLFLVEAS